MVHSILGHTLGKNKGRMLDVGRSWKINQNITYHYCLPITLVANKCLASRSKTSWLLGFMEMCLDLKPARCKPAQPIVLITSVFGSMHIKVHPFPRMWQIPNWAVCVCVCAWARVCARVWDHCSEHNHSFQLFWVSVWIDDTTGSLSIYLTSR